MRRRFLPIFRSRESGALRALAVGAQALGALAVGALAVGAVAIGRLAVGRARIRRLEIDELVVRNLRAADDLQLPPAQSAAGDRIPKKEVGMAKELRCGDLMPGCKTVVEGKDEAEVMARAAEHAKTAHGLEQISPELAGQVRSAIKEKGPSQTA
jgi:predicted small metal-binding protein